MGWVEQPHRCKPPVHVHQSNPDLGAFWECDHCLRTWKVTGSRPSAGMNKLLDFKYTDESGTLVLTIHGELVA